MKILGFIFMLWTLSSSAQTTMGINGMFIENIAKEDICYDRALFPLATTLVNLTSPYNYTGDTAEFSRIAQVMPNLRTLTIQNGIFGKIPDAILNSGVQTVQISISGTTGFPNAYSGSQIRTLMFDQMNAIPVILPNSWSNMRYVNNIYLRQNGYNTSQLNNIIAQFETLINAGMGQLTTGTHNIYLNQLGTNQNGIPTIATFTGSGWVQTGTAQTSRLTRTILGNLWQIYYNP